MENTVKRIVDIENDAKQIVEQAQKESENLPEQIEAELSDYRKELEKKLGEETDARLSQEKAQFERDCNAMKKRAADSTELLRAAYAKHGAEWSQKLFDGIMRDE